MSAATRSRLESSAPESTPRLLVETARKIFSDINSSAAPTEINAATCFAELGFEPGMTASREFARAGNGHQRWTASRPFQRRSAACESDQSGGGATMGMRRASL